MSEHLVRLRGLHIATHARDLVRGVDLDVYAGRVTAVMGPSGSGKTLTANAVMGLIEVDPGLRAGTLEFPALGAQDWFAGVCGGGARAQRRLLEQTRTLRGSFMTYSPQTASSALNPGRTVGRQLELAIRRRPQGATFTPAEVAAAVRRSLDPADTENLVVISLGHVHELRSDGHSHHCGAQQPSFEIVAPLVLGYDGMILEIAGLNRFHGMVQIGIEWAPFCNNRLYPEFLQGVQQSLVYQFNSLGVLGVSRIRFQRALEIVEHR